MSRRQLSKLIFHKDSIALIISLVFIWFTISLIVDSKLNEKDLMPHIGILIQIDSAITKVKNKPLFKEITKELRLTINNEETPFTSLTTEHFGDIISQIDVGDSVKIYTKPRVWRIFGLKKEKDISHLTKGDSIIINYEKYKKSISGLFTIPLLVSVGFLIFYLHRVTRRYNFDIRQRLTL